MINAKPTLMTTPRDSDLGLAHIGNAGGMSVSALPNGCIFAIEHQDAHNRIMINQVLGSPLDGGIGRLILRIGGTEPRAVEIVGPGANVRFGTGTDRFVWEGETEAMRHRVTLWLHPDRRVWLWYVELTLDGGAPANVPCDVVLIQDVGLGHRGFLMNCELYASQYTDHHIASHPGFGPVIMNRQNLDQGGRHPWAAHGCIDGAAGFATDALQLFGPAWRDDGTFAFPFGVDLPNARLQHEAACAGLRSHALTLAPGETTDLTFFGIYEPDHPDASGDADLTRVDAVVEAAREFVPAEIPLNQPVRNVVRDAAPLASLPFDDAALAQIWPTRTHEERGPDGRLMSFFAPDGELNRHVVLAAKERAVARRHGTILRTGTALLPDDATMCATCWMHGVFGAQLTLGNTSLHKLFTVSRDAYNIMRGNGLRILVDAGDGWRALGMPSAFEMGLSDCRWIYRLGGGGVVTVHAIASGEEAAMQWRVTAEGRPSRFLVYANVVAGEREYEGAAPITITDTTAQFRFDPGALWGQRFPDAGFDFAASTPAVVEAFGGDELLYADGKQRTGAYVAFRTRPTQELVFAVSGSLTSIGESQRLAAKYAAPVESAAMLAPAAAFWQHLTGIARIPADVPDASAHNTLLPWLVHNALIHLTVPHGLEQFSGGAWGTRDVCQGPIELLLALGHDAPVQDVLRRVFAQQYAPTHVDASDRRELAGDWPQWFMFEPYAFIQGAPAHGDIIVWPLKAVCDYIEATGDFAFLDEPVAWRRQDNFETTARTDTFAAHIDAALHTIRSRFIPGTQLLRIGEGDWNDALQPADPSMREHMVSSWTVALLYHQLTRYAEVMRRAGHAAKAGELDALTASIRADYHRHLVVDGTVAGYAMFGDGAGAAPQLLMHPSDTRTGIHYSLIALTGGLNAGLFSLGEAAHHMRLIHDYLHYPDGVRLMDRMMPYSGGLERLFRRAESAAFVGREISLMYVHSHLRYCDALAALGDTGALREGLAVANPILVTERLAHATMRQRNAYFSSSDAAFPDRATADAEWGRLKTGAVAVDGGWRIYSSGPGLFVRLLVRHLMGRARDFGDQQTS